MALGVHGVGTLHKKNLDLMQMQKAKMDDQQLEWKMNKKSSLDENFETQLAEQNLP
jgi:peroxiredoxin family protein